MRRTFDTLSMRNKLIIVLLLGVLAPALSSCGRKKAPPPRTVPVVAEVADRKNVPLQIKTIGNVEPFNAVTVKALVGGEIHPAAVGGRRDTGDL